MFDWDAIEIRYNLSRESGKCTAVVNISVNTLNFKLLFSHEFADVIFALKSVDDFAVDVTIQEHSEHTSLFLSVLAGLFLDNLVVLARLEICQPVIRIALTCIEFVM